MTNNASHIVQHHFIGQNCSVVVLEEKGLQCGQHLHSNTYSLHLKKHEEKTKQAKQTELLGYHIVSCKFTVCLIV